MPNVDDDVIRGLYEAPAGVVPWSPSLGRWHSAMEPLFAVQLLAVAADSGRLLFSDASPQSPPEALRDHVRHWHRASPHIPVLAASPVGELMHTADRFPAERWADHPFYTEFWATYRIRSLVAAKVAHTPAGLWMVAISRRDDHPPFTATDLLRIQRYVDHIVSAFRLVTHLRPGHSASLLGQQLLQTSQRPMLLLDEQLNLHGGNAPGQAWLAQGLGLRQDAGRLQGHDATTSTALQRAMQRIGLGSGKGAAGRTAVQRTAVQRTALRLIGSDGEPLLCSLWNLRPQDTLGATPGSGTVLLTVHTERQLDDADTEWLGVMFNLTPAEVAVAAQLLRGMEAKQIARANHRSLHTVRSQMRSLLLKTGSRRQADLVRALMQASSL